MDMVLDLMEGGGRSSFPSASDRGLLRGLGRVGGQAELVHHFLRRLLIHRHSACGKIAVSLA